MCRQAQKCCLGLGRAWVGYGNTMGGVGEKKGNGVLGCVIKEKYEKLLGDGK